MSIDTEFAWVGRANVIQRALTDGGVELSASDQEAITKVSAAFGDFCIDTETTPDLVVYEDGVVSLVIGNTPGIVPGLYRVNLTVFDAVTPEGYAWGKFNLIVRTTEDCGSS